MLLSKVNLGRMGFIYFFSCTLATVLAVISPIPSVIYDWLAITSKGLLLLAVVSISYQLFAKRFCLLCLGIMGILVVNGVLAFSVKGIPFSFSLDIGLYFLIVVLASSGLLYMCENMQV